MAPSPRALSVLIGLSPELARQFEDLIPMQVLENPNFKAIDYAHLDSKITAGFGLLTPRDQRLLALDVAEMVLPHIEAGLSTKKKELVREILTETRQHPDSPDRLLALNGQVSSHLLHSSLSAKDPGRYQATRVLELATNPKAGKPKEALTHAPRSAWALIDRNKYTEAEHEKLTRLAYSKMERNIFHRLVRYLTGDAQGFPDLDTVGSVGPSLSTMSAAAFSRLSESEKDRLSYHEDTWLRPGMIGKEVELHLNLGLKSHPPRSLQTWSVRDAKTHKVMGHVFAARLKDVKFTMQPTATMEAVIAQNKTPHAYARGILDAVDLKLPLKIRPLQAKSNVRYSPNVAGHMFFLREDGRGNWTVPVQSASEVTLIGGKGTGWHLMAKSLVDMSPAEIKKNLTLRQAAYLEHKDEWEEIRKKKDKAHLIAQREAGKNWLVDGEIDRQVEALSEARMAKYATMASERVGRRSKISFH